MENAIIYELIQQNSTIITQEDTQYATSPKNFETQNTLVDETQPNTPPPTQTRSQKTWSPATASQLLLGPEVEVSEQSMLVDDFEVKDEIKEEVESDWEEIEASAIAREQGQFWDQS